MAGVVVDLGADSVEDLTVRDLWEVEMYYFRSIYDLTLWSQFEATAFAKLTRFNEGEDPQRASGGPLRREPCRAWTAAIATAKYHHPEASTLQNMVDVAATEDERNELVNGRPGTWAWHTWQEYLDP